MPENLFSERVKFVRQEIIDKYGNEIADRILLCGGTARSWIMQEDPLDNRGGDIDYAVAMEIPEETRKGINEIFSKYANGGPDDLTDPDLPFSQNMQKEGYIDIYDAIRKDPTFSIDKIAINIGNGEIFDPHGGLKDFKNGILRIVGENLNTRLTERGWLKSKEALALAFRGARFGAQYGMEIDPNTETFFKSLMEKNKFMNRFHIVMRGIDELIWDKNYRQLAEESITGYPQEGEDIRFTGKKFEPKVGPIKFVTSTFAISRMLSYLLAGL